MYASLGKSPSLINTKHYQSHLGTKAGLVYSQVYTARDSR